MFLLLSFVFVLSISSVKTWGFWVRTLYLVVLELVHRSISSFMNIVQKD